MAAVPYNLETRFSRDIEEDAITVAPQPELHDHVHRLRDLRLTRKRNAVFWQFVALIKDVQAPHMCSRNIASGTLTVPMGLLRCVATRMQLDGLGEGFLDNVWAMFCGLLAVSYRPLSDQSITVSKGFYQTAVKPMEISFADNRWVTLRFAGVLQYFACDRSSLTLDLKQPDLPDFVELDRSGRRAILLTRPWVILKGSSFFKFTDTDHSLTM